MAEQNNELLMKNHEARPTGSTAFPEVNAVTYTTENVRGRGRGRGCGGGRGRGRGRSFDRGQNNYHGGYNSKNTNYHQKWDNNYAKQNKRKGGQNSKNVESKCYRCGMTGHWSRTCRTPKHLVELYQASLKEKGTNIETNCVFQDDDPMDITHLDVADFFAPIEKEN